MPTYEANSNGDGRPLSEHYDEKSGYKLGSKGHETTHGWKVEDDDVAVTVKGGKVVDRVKK